MDATMHKPISTGAVAPLWRSARKWVSHGRRLRDGHLWLAWLGAFAVLNWSGPLLRYLDATAAVVDIGAASLALLALAAAIGFVNVSRWLLGLLWPVLRDYHRHHFEPNFKSLLPWQKITFYLVIFFGLLYAFVCCLAAVSG